MNAANPPLTGVAQAAIEHYTLEQLNLFPRDGATDLARACLDLAWGITQQRGYLTLEAESELWCCLAYVRERVVALSHVQKVLRGLVQIPSQPAQYELRARPDQPPTLVRRREVA